MPDLDQLVVTASRSTNPQQPQRGVISKAPANDVDGIFVIIPEYDDELAFGPCSWMPRGSQMPAVGAGCFVVFSNTGEPFVAVWEGTGEEDGGGDGGAVVGPWIPLVLEADWETFDGAFWRVEGVDVIRLMGMISFAGTPPAGISMIAIPANNPGLVSGRESRVSATWDSGYGGLYLGQGGLALMENGGTASYVFLDGATFLFNAVPEPEIDWGAPISDWKWNAKTDVIETIDAGVHTNNMPSASICKNNANPALATKVQITERGLGPHTESALSAITTGKLMRIGYPAAADPPTGFEAIYRATGPSTSHSGFEQVWYYEIPVEIVSTEGDSTHFGENHTLWLADAP